MVVVKLTGPLARRAACQHIQEAPEGFLMRLSEPTRSLEANALLHAELQEVAGCVEWGGGLQTVETWKRLLTAGWMRATNRKVTLLPAIEGSGFDVLYQRTSTLTSGEMNELISYIQAWKADRPELEEAA